MEKLKFCHVDELYTCIYIYIYFKDSAYARVPCISTTGCVVTRKTICASSTRSSSFRSRPCRHCRCFSIFLTPVEGTILILYTRSLSTLGNDTRSARKRAITRAETCHGFTLPSAHASFLFLSSFTSFVSELCGNSREFVRLRVDCFHLYLDSLLNLLSS